MPKDKKKENIYEVAYDDMATFEVFFAENWKKIFQFCAVVVIVIAVYMLAKYYNNRHEAFIAGEISKANRAAETPGGNIQLRYISGCWLGKAAPRTDLFQGQEVWWSLQNSIQISLSRKMRDIAESETQSGLYYGGTGQKNEAAAKFAEFSARIGLPEDVRLRRHTCGARLQGTRRSWKARSSLETFNNIDAQMANNFWAEKAQRLKTLIKWTSNIQLQYSPDCVFRWILLVKVVLGRTETILAAIWSRRGILHGNPLIRSEQSNLQPLKQYNRKVFFRSLKIELDNLGVSHAAGIRPDYLMKIASQFSGQAVSSFLGTIVFLSSTNHSDISPSSVP